MRLATFTKSLLCAALLATTACVQQPGQLTDSSGKQVVADSWHWDDQQKQWFYNGSSFDVKTSGYSALWKPEKQAISLDIKSGKSLNSFDNAPNGLLMRVFQLSDPTAFLKAAESSSGLRRLLTAEQIDPACVGTERLIVLPGNTQKLTLDRIEGARYIGVILGYSNLKQAKIFRLIPIVTIKNRPVKQAVKKEPSLFSSFWKTDSPKKSTQPVAIDSRPALLKLKLSLGADGISNLDIDAK